ncbi:MAG: DUF3857 domain-containing protein [Chloracidobacterium sp.]|nr:DUF3857 domain-containing protein [Chloracidobacterium sp.]
MSTRSTLPLRSVFLAALLLCGAVTGAYADDQIPAWMTQAARGVVPSYDKDVPAVVLHDEQQITYSDGRLLSVENYAVKLLSKEGRRFAVARAYYLVSSGKVKDIVAWLIRPDGTTKAYDKKSVLDIIADKDDVYNEGRIKLIDASGDVETGYVFGYTIISEDTPLFYQDTWRFQGRLPTLLSRYSISLPAGWSASSITFNSPEIKPTVNGTTYSWEMRGLKPVPPEPMSPAIVNLVPRIAVNYGPDNKTQTRDRVFEDWTEVSRWATAMYDPQVVMDDNIAGKARDLTEGSQTELDRIRAIGNYVQNLQYISIDIGVGYGNGYRPRSSALVMSRGYGDCKDKANLMRAMLRALKIEAYPIAIYSGDPTYVRSQWASPRQFNHCIIAVKVSDSTVGPTVISHPTLGRLLIFDATDPYTPVGDLPDYLQGSMALLIAGEKGGLVQMPISPPDTDVLDRRIDAEISVTGEVAGKILERASGQISTTFRRELREYSSADYRKAVESWLTRGSSGATLIDVRSKDRASEAGFDLDVTFAAPRYGQLMQDRLLVFKTVVVGRRNDISLTESRRTNPIEIDSFSMRNCGLWITAGICRRRNA